MKKSFGYVSGLNNDAGVNKVMIEVNKDGLNICHKRMQDVITVPYADIVGIELHSDIDIQKSTPKSLFSAAVLGSVGAIGVVTAIITLFFVPKREKREQKSADNFLLALKDILKNKACVLLIALTILKACLIMSFGTYIPFLLKQYGFITTQTGLIMTTFFIMGGLAMMFASHLEKRIKLKGMIVASYMPLLPLTLLAVLSLKYYSKILAVILFILIGFFILLAAGSILAKAQKLIPNNTGTISGIIQGFTLALGSLLLIPLGNLGQHFGVSWVLISVTSIAAVAALYCAKTKILE